MQSQLKAGAVLNYILLILNTIVNLLYTPFMLRMMGQSEYGLYSLVASVIAYLTILDFGFGNAIVRYTAKYRAENRVQEQYKMFGMFFVLYVVIGAIAFLAGLGLFFNVDLLFGETMTILELYKARIMLLILIFNVAFTFPMSIFSGIIMAYERFVFPKVVIIARILLNTLVMVVLLKMGYKAITMVLVQTIFNVLTLFLNYSYCKKKLRIKIVFGHFNWSFLKEVSIFSFWIFLNVIADKVYWSTGQFVLGALVGTTAVSVFAVAIQLESMYMQFSTAIAGVFLPKITTMVALGDNRNEISDLFIKTGRIQNLIMFMLLCGFTVFGQQFICLWAGKEYSSAYYMTLLFWVALYIPLIQNMGISILQARNQMKFRCILYFVIALFAVFGEIALVKMWGGVGCAMAISCSLILGHGLIMNIYYRRQQGVDIVRFWKVIIKMDVAPLFISVFFYCLTHIYIEISTWSSLIIWISLFGISYIIVTILFGMNHYERYLLVEPIMHRLKK